VGTHFQAHPAADALFLVHPESGHVFKVDKAIHLHSFNPSGRTSSQMNTKSITVNENVNLLKPVHYQLEIVLKKINLDPSRKTGPPARPISRGTAQRISFFTPDRDV